MSLLNNNSVDSGTENRQKIIGQVNTLVGTMTRIYASIYRQTFEHPTLSIQEVFDAFGEQGEEYHGILLTLFSAVDSLTPGALDNPPLEVLYNTDGTVDALSEPASSSSSST